MKLSNIITLLEQVKQRQYKFPQCKAMAVAEGITNPSNSWLALEENLQLAIDHLVRKQA